MVGLEERAGRGQPYGSRTGGGSPLPAPSPRTWGFVQFRERLAAEPLLPSLRRCAALRPSQLSVPATFAGPAIGDDPKFRMRSVSSSSLGRRGCPFFHSSSQTLDALGTPDQRSLSPRRECT